LTKEQIQLLNSTAVLLQASNVICWQH